MNIFEIQNDLLNIFQNIEDNDGEITPEMEEQLAITQENFSNKLKSYADVVKLRKNEINLIDDEIKRLNEVKKSKKSLIDRLNKIITEAVIKFGNETKSGGNFFDYGTGKISIRNTKKVETNDTLSNILANNLFAKLGFMSFSNLLECTDSVDKESILKDFNAEHVSQVTENDLKATKANISFDVSLDSILSGEGYDFIKSLIKHSGLLNYKLKANVDKTLIKNNSDATFNVGTIVDNKTVQFK